jgi:hypothetical protein
MTTYTQYADNYLAGYNSVPVGVLDHPQFRAEVRRLSGWTPEREAEQRLYEVRTVKRLERVLARVRGPRGGIPREYRYIARAVEQLRNSGAN